MQFKRRSWENLSEAFFLLRSAASLECGGACLEAKGAAEQKLSSESRVAWPCIRSLLRPSQQCRHSLFTKSKFTLKLFSCCECESASLMSRKCVWLCLVKLNKKRVASESSVGDVATFRCDLRAKWAPKRPVERDRASLFLAFAL